MKAVAANSGLASTNYVEDKTDPVVTATVGFEKFDLNLGRITLAFSEMINRESFQFKLVTVADEDSKTRAKTPFTLTGGTIVETEHKTKLTIQLIPKDLNSIKANVDLCVRRTSCYLAAGVGLFKDFAGNSLEATKDTDYLKPVTFTDDSTKPKLVSFGIDMNLGTLRLSFDETVNIDKLLRSGITVMNAKSGSNKVTLEPCPDGICSPSKIGDDITVSITDGDINKIKLLQFATKASDAFVSITDTTITDVARTPNAVEAVTANTAVVATLGYTKDQKSPKLSAVWVRPGNRQALDDVH